MLSKYPKYFLVQIGSKSDSVSVDRLKLVFSKHPVVLQQPPLHGRPPSSLALLTLALMNPALLALTSKIPL